MIMTRNIFPTKKLSKEFSGLELFEAAGYIKKLSSGFYAYLPLGNELLQNLSNQIRSIATDSGFYEISIPLLQDAELWQLSGRMKKYANSFFTISNPDGSDYIVSPTCEEAVLSLYDGLHLNDDALPWRVFQIGERERNELRPAYGLVRSKSFVLADFYSLSKSDSEASNELDQLSSMISILLTRLGIEIKKAKYLYQDNTFSFWTNSKSVQCHPIICNNCNSSFRHNQHISGCPICSSSNISVVDGTELADVAVKGCEIPNSMGVTTNNCEQIFLTVAGIGVGRLAQILAEQHSDKNGIVWPYEIAPYKVHIVSNDERKSEAIALHDKLIASGIKSIVDLRNLSMSKKLIDADLIGCPEQVIFGKNTKDSQAELKNRLTGEKRHISTSSISSYILKGGNHNE